MFESISYIGLPTPSATDCSPHGLSQAHRGAEAVEVGAGPLQPETKHRSLVTTQYLEAGRVVVAVGDEERRRKQRQ